MTESTVDVGTHENLVLFAAEGNQLWMAWTFKINFLNLSPYKRKTALPARKNVSPALEAIGGYDEKFSLDHSSGMGSGEAACGQPVNSIPPVASWLDLPAGGWRLVSSLLTHHWSSFPGSGPSIS